MQLQAMGVLTFDDGRRRKICRTQEQSAVAGLPGVGLKP